MVTAYVMRAFKTTSPTGHVYWSVLNTPDNVGTYSGYNPADLSSISTDYTYTTTLSGTANSVTTGLASGDLSGVYPNPSVAKIQGYLISPITPIDGYVLAWDNTDGYWQPKSPAIITLNKFDFTGGLDSGGRVLPNSQAFRNGLQTTDATANRVISAVIPADGQIIRVLSEVLAKRTDLDGYAAWFILKAIYLRNGGSLIVIKEPTVVDTGATSGATGWTAQIAANGTAVETQVTGQAGATIHWSVIREFIEAS